ncbi:hypothetical protein VSDG_02534 [Cytospora chrysosperma]|uniref:Mediator of RNA polymerase II transcription subunit 21 n=1 Tax=Cytospora chrysosperma TaxID=252740 RepID=A0A423WFM9_CYTCH|nr:hypothetical protein VSDG_02534 [Valsa sordida]
MLLIRSLQLAQQFVACIHFIHRYHDRETLGPNDKIREVKPEEDRKEILPIAHDEFKAGQQELARDLVLKEQQIEFIISSLPGLENNAEAQERSIRELEEELRTAEAQRQTAMREMNAVKEKLDQVIRGTKRP